MPIARSVFAQSKKPAFSPATAFSLTGPVTGANGVAAIYTVTPNRFIGTTDVVVTPAATNGGVVSPATLTFAAGTTAAQTFSVTLSIDGSSSVSISNNGGLTNSGSPIIFSTATDATWSSTVPDVSFQQGAASSYNLVQHTSNVVPGSHVFQVDTGTLPTGVTLATTGLLSYNGSSPIASAAGVSYRIADTADADFLARSSAPTVLRSFGFNSAGDLGGAFGANFGTVPGTGTVGLDTTVKASGASSLKFGLLAGGHANGGGNSSSWFTNFTSDLQRFGASSEFFYQFKVRISQTAFEDYTHKFFLCGSGDDGTNVFASCTDLEIEMEHYGNANGVSAANRFPIMYNACPGSCGGVFAFYETLSGGNFDLQPNGVAPVCSYQDGSKAGCVQLVPESWMVFQVGVTLGPRVTSGGHYWFQGSRIRMWMQTSPGATEQLVIDWLTNATAGSQIGLCAGHGATGDQRYGKLWLLPYTQNSIGTSARAGSVWYDELIIATAKIAAAQA
jgi:hypothetical protein